jgi:hypothetical protein
MDCLTEHLPAMGRPMTNERHDYSQLVRDIDARQNEVLEQLDQLNAQVESLLHAWTRRDDAATVADKCSGD